MDPDPAEARRVVSLLSKKPPRPSGWASTRWSIVTSLDRQAEPTWEVNWAYLVDAYRAPMEGYVRRLLGRLRNRPCSTEEAAEVTQDFLVACATKEWLSKADPAKGRFRAFLQAILRRYVYRHLKLERAQKRAPSDGHRVLTILDGDAADEGLSPADREDWEAFDRSWVRIALDRALARLRSQNERYALVIDDLVLTGGDGSPDLPQRVGLRPAQFPVLRHRARERFAGLFEEELASTVADEAAFEEEWRALSAYLP